MDVKDILGLPKNTLQLRQEKKSRPPKEPQRKPDGISRELYMLTGGSGAGGGKKAAAVETMVACSLEELYKGSKRKMKISRVVSDDFGCVLSGGGSVPDPKVHVEAWVKMVNEFQKGAMATRLGIPMQVMDTTSIMPLLPSQRGAWCHQANHKLKNAVCFGFN